MHEETFCDVGAAATVVTASRRLARVLTHQFHFRQQQRAHSVWRTPDILPIDAFLARAWRASVLNGAVPEAPALLDPFQEQLIWEQVIRNSPAGDSLLRIPETAQKAAEAWKLIHAYRLPVDGRFEASDDWSAFAAWSRAFQKRCQANRWLEAARLSDVVTAHIKSGETMLPSRLYRAGFDELTPQQREFFEAVGNYREVELQDFAAAPQCFKFQDTTAETRAAAGWARQRLENDPSAKIGVIVPNLTSTRSTVERIFRELLHPGAQPDERELSFHLSLGPPLDQYPLVRSALQVLEFGLGPMTLARAGVLLRSPFLAGAEAELTKRASLDARLRRDGLWEVTPRSLCDAAVHCPRLQHALQRFEKQAGKLPAGQRPSEWARSFSKLLEALGWPGERTLTSREHQVVEAWLALLSNFGALDIASPTMSLDQALSQLSEIAAGTPFQIENEGAPVEVMGMLEASGLRFDHLWIMGLHDEALPARSNPHPFLPISLQQEHDLPHSSAARELDFSRILLTRLLGSAPNVILSYPEAEDDRLLAPSPLISAGAWRTHGTARSDEWIARIRTSVTMDEFGDEVAPPAHRDAKQSGGASLFKDMSACPFRAFAKHRLGARPLEDTELGLSYRDRGTTVHRALQLIWTELGSQARLKEIAPQELQTLIAQHVDAAVDHLGPGIGRHLERRRLQHLLTEWLEIEKSRFEFTVLKPEEERLVTIGGVQVRTRVDRVDLLASGGEIILDYKTGQVKSGAWDGDRPDDPQVPLYCASSERSIAGAAFAIIRTGELAFRGIAENSATLPDMKRMNSPRNVTVLQQIAEWKHVLVRLAEDFRGGVARVDPKPDACDHCGLTALCRVLETDRGGDNDRG